MVYGWISTPFACPAIRLVVSSPALASKFVVESEQYVEPPAPPDEPLIDLLENAPEVFEEPRLIRSPLTYPVMSLACCCLIYHSQLYY